MVAALFLQIRSGVEAFLLPAENDLFVFIGE
jgi:hypothetical protein